MKKASIYSDLEFCSSWFKQRQWLVANGFDVENEFSAEEDKYYDCLNKHNLLHKGKLFRYYNAVKQRVSFLQGRVKFGDQ